MLRDKDRTLTARLWASRAPYTIPRVFHYR